ncbi:MAG TPA: membrane dipeptidase [Candidatus Acidoferrum sp.]|jgi:hypothetical protein|nr:membrane dipeptidase [Candidatus Acidoferrum sp.]
MPSHAQPSNDLAEIRQILREVPLIDGHNDLPWQFRKLKKDINGIDHVGLGSDFEGFHGSVERLEDVSKYPALLAELRRRGFTVEDIKKVAGLNLLRVMR